MARVSTHVQDPEITIEHLICRLENGAYTYTTRTVVVVEDDIEDAGRLAAEVARKADDIARQELIRRMTADVKTLSTPEVIETWGQIQELRDEHKIG
jgi:hypothetical protein